MWTRRRVNMNISGKKTPQIHGTNNCDNFIMQRCIRQSMNLFFLAGIPEITCWLWFNHLITKMSHLIQIFLMSQYVSNVVLNQNSLGKQLQLEKVIPKKNLKLEHFCRCHSYGYGRRSWSSTGDHTDIRCK